METDINTIYNISKPLFDNSSALINGTTTVTGYFNTYTWVIGQDLVIELLTAILVVNVLILLMLIAIVIKQYFIRV